MRTVRVRESTDDDGDGLPEGVGPGDRQVLLRRDGTAWLVRDPATGRRRRLPADRLRPVEEPPLPVGDGRLRPLATAAPDGRLLGLLLELVARADGESDERRATRVRVLLDAGTLCESDLHGAVAELRAAGLIERVRRRTGRAYRPTDAAVAAVERARSRPAP